MKYEFTDCIRRNKVTCFIPFLFPHFCNCNKIELDEPPRETGVHGTPSSCHPSVQKFLRQWRIGIPLTLDRNQSLFLQLVHNMRKNNRSIVKNCHCNNYQISKIYKMNMTNLFSIFINSSQEGFSISNNFMRGAFKKRLITCKV